MVEEKSSQDHQQDAGTAPKAIAAQSTPLTEVKSPPPVVPQQQTGAQPASSPTQRQEANAEEAIEKDLTKFERRILLATWAGVTAAAMTGVFIYSQFRVMTDQTNILSTQTIGAIADSIESGRRVEKQLSIAQQQATAAQDSVKGIKRQLRQDQEAMIVDERPWIGVIQVQTIGGIDSDTNFEVQEVNVVLRNSGKTPAVRVKFEWRDWEQPIDRAIPEYDAFMALSHARSMNVFNGNVLAPSAPGSIPLLGLRTVWSKDRHPDARLTVVYILGKLTYFDIFPKTPQHTTKFCLMHVSGPNFGLCPQSNWMD